MVNIYILYCKQMITHPINLSKNVFKVSEPQATQAWYQHDFYCHFVSILDEMMCTKPHFPLA